MTRRDYILIARTLSECRDHKTCDGTTQVDQGTVDHLVDCFANALKEANPRGFDAGLFRKNAGS